jgi:fatty-acyl-CoA synthase
MDFHFASAWELISDAYPNRTATIGDGHYLSWREYEARAASLATLLAEHGFSVGSKAGLYMHNRSEYQEAQFAVFKAGGCPINVNYRYKADELIYLLDNSDCEVVFFQSCYAMRIWEIKNRLPKIKLFVQIDDGTEALLKGAVDYERATRQNKPARRVSQDPEGVYMLYTGGTTGMPKGVMYPVGRFTEFLIGMGAVGRGLTPPENMSGYLSFLEQIEEPPVSLPACPLMHGTGVWLGSFLPMLMGGTVVTTSKLGLDPDLLLGQVEDYRVSDAVIVGDAFARPILRALDDAEKRGTPYDLTSLKQITSSGVMWSQEIKQGLLRHHNMVLADVMGSTEGGMGSSVTTREDLKGTAKFELNEGVRVVTDDGRFVEAGSGEMGKIATSSFVPLGYYKDEEKSAATFREIDGVRYSFPGDYATVEADGSITLLGRGSACINSGGEKVFPEEVEEAVKRHEAVLDCLVVGVPDDRFGERIVAVMSLKEGCSLTDDALKSFAAEHLSGYKVPRQILCAPEVRRAPNGKADYKWASALALDAQ